MFFLFNPKKLQKKNGYVELVNNHEIIPLSEITFYRLMDSSNIYNELKILVTKRIQTNAALFGINLNITNLIIVLTNIICGPN